MVGLVNYDSDESEDSVQSSQLSSNNRLPPLPCSFYNVYTSNPKLSEDPGFHEGRTREIAHVQGGWPSHIYLEYLPKEPEFSVLKFIYNDAIAQSRIDSPIRRCVSLLESELLVQKPLHVSLSVTLMVPTESKQKLLDQVRAAVNLGRSRPTQTPHTVQYAMEPVVQCVLSYTLRILSNPQKTRAFLVILIDSPDQSLISRINDVCADLNLPIFDPDHVAHLSIGWLDLQSLGQSERDEILNFEVHVPLKNPITINFPTVKLKIGRQINEL